ncbi:MAG: putative IQ calmodulin-binding motif family protein [Streblomastix strix]|uniref:Putative IQ calmodulin-binding motif family protein n=1 Tax=Streblomastix strix TaxID=222440 RepID=A0A5J4WFM3_9EUKA|nr:MAG: putative IQ calmodulin-binding motif family protein [Streblomastix strix]
MDQNKAAQIIQHTWRRFTDIRLFKYYRELISFHEKGQPINLLRGINPSESELLDPAVSACVRFRLGGNYFPPMIFYKIYIRAPLCDLNSFAPRDYTRPFRKRRWLKPQGMKFKKSQIKQEFMPTGRGTSEEQRNMKYNSNGGQTAQQIRSITTISDKIDDEQLEGLTSTDVDGWYLRNDEEGNNWRPITERGYKQLVKMAPQDVYSYSSKHGGASAGFSYHFLTSHSAFVNDRMIRRKGVRTHGEKERIKKIKALKWFRKATQMDKDLDAIIAEMEVIDEVSASDEKEEINEQTSKQDEDQNTNQRRGESSGNKKENKPNRQTKIQKIIDWAQELDYSSYLQEWSQIGTSERSDTQIERRKDLSAMQEELLKHMKDVSRSDYKTDEEIFGIQDEDEQQEEIQEES